MVMLSVMGRNRAKWEVDTKLNFGPVKLWLLGISQVGKSSWKLEMRDSELMR